LAWHKIKEEADDYDCLLTVTRILSAATRSDGADRFVREGAQSDRPYGWPWSTSPHCSVKAFQTILSARPGRVSATWLWRMAEPPPNDVKRWTAKRKSAVLDAIRNGAMSVEEACSRYEISGEELLAWMAVFEIHGLPGLRTTQTQYYRHGKLTRTPRRRS